VALRLRAALASRGAPRVVDAQWLASAAPPGTRPDVMLRAAESLCGEGSLGRVARGTWLNWRAEPRPEACEAARLLRPGAVVSLHTVLGDAGVLNNYVREVVAVVPGSNGSAGQRPVAGPAATFRFHLVDRRVLEAGGERDRLDLAPYARATPEAAMVHMAYLASASRSGVRVLPRELDLSQVDPARLRRLSSAAGVESAVAAWLDLAAAYAADPGSRSDGGHTLGF
jgi:hypothetical protein